MLFVPGLEAKKVKVKEEIKTLGVGGSRVVELT